MSNDNDIERVTKIAEECGATKRIGVLDKKDGVVTEKYVYYSFAGEELLAFEQMALKAKDEEIVSTVKAIDSALLESLHKTVEAKQEEIKSLRTKLAMQASQARELRGIAADVDLGEGFDDVCRETLGRVITNLSATSKEVAKWEAEKKAEIEMGVLEDWDDLLEDLELHGMHDFEPYIRSKAKFKTYGGVR